MFAGVGRAGTFKVFWAEDAWQMRIDYQNFPDICPKKADFANKRFHDHKKKSLGSSTNPSYL
ncbi:MAG: hypothetical protein OHK0053_02580 [Microscillaceae bacterium]